MRDTIVNETEKTETLVKLEVYDGASWISFGNNANNDRLYSVSLDNSVDSSSWALEARFRNHPDAGDSLDPYPAGTFQNLLAQYNKCHLDISKDGGTNWYRMFEGYSSETSPEHKVDKDDTVIYRPVDPSKRLKDRIIPWDLTGWDSELSYRNIDAFDAVDDILSAAGFSETMNKNISDDPQKTIYGNKPYEPRGMTVWSAIQKIFEETGYNVAYRFNDNNNPATLDLAVIDPSHDLATSGRADSSDWSESWIDNNFRIFQGDFDRRELTVDDKDVRTKVTVWYQGEDGQQRVSVKSDNSPNAIPAGGSSLHREQIMTEPDDSLIDKKVEALNLAQITLDDLRAPSPDVAFDFPFFYPSAQLTDVYRMGGAGDYTVDLFVTDISHTIDVGRKIGTTTLSGAADRVIGRRNYWLNKDLDDDEDIRQRGDGRPPNPPKNAPRIEKSIYQVESSGETRASIVTIGEHAPEFDIIYYKWQYRIYNGDNWLGWENAGTSDKDHPQSTISSLAVGSDRKIQVRYAPIDRQSRESGGTAPWSPAQGIPLNGDATEPQSPSNVTVSPGPEKITITWTNPTTDGNGSKLHDLDDVVVYIKKSGEPTKKDYDTRQEAGKNEQWVFDTTNVNTIYNIRLSAEDNSENESELTDNITASPNAKVGDDEAPPTPTGLEIADSYVDRQEDGTLYAVVELNWDDINTDVVEDFKSYELQQSTDNGSTWSYVSQSAPKASEATVKPLKPDTAYDYRIRSEDTEQNQSSWTSALSVTTARDEIPPSTPEGLSAIPDKGSVLLEWDQVTENADQESSPCYDLDYYKVYVDTGETFIAEGTSFTYYGDYNTTYSFNVSAIDTSGNESAKAGPVNASPDQIFNTDLAFDALDLSLDDALDKIPSDGNFGKVANTNIDPNGKILLSEVTGDLSSIPDSNINPNEDYALVKSTYMEAGKITLAEGVIGSIGDISDDPDSADPQYSKVKATYIDSGEIKLANIDGNVEDLPSENVDDWDVVSATDIKGGRIDLVYGDDDQIKIGKNAITTGQGGMVVSDGTVNRVLLGEVAGGEYGLVIQDSNGNDLLRSTNDQETGNLGDTYISTLTSDSIDVEDILTISNRVRIGEDVNAFSSNKIDGIAVDDSTGNMVAMLGQYQDGRSGLWLRDEAGNWIAEFSDDTQWIDGNFEIRGKLYADDFESSTLNADVVTIKNLSVNEISGTGDLATKSSVSSYNDEIEINSTLSIDGSIKSQYGEWEIKGSGEAYFQNVTELQSANDDPIISNGNYISGVRVVDLDTLPEGGSQDVVWDRVNKTVPTGKKWVVQVQEYPVDSLSWPVSITSMNAGQLDDFVYGICGYFTGDYGSTHIGGILDEGSYSGLSLSIQHYISFTRGDGTSFNKAPPVFWMVVEYPT